MGTAAIGLPPGAARRLHPAGDPKTSH